MNIEIYKQLKRKYDVKRQIVINDVSRKKDKLLKQLPKYQELEDRKNSIAIEHAKSIISKSGIEKQIAEENLKIKLDEIENDIKVLLKNNGIEENYLKPNFECKKCNDTGLIISEDGQKYCGCFVQQAVNIMYKQYNILKINEENFNTFDVGYYSDKIDEKKYHSSISPRDNILKIKKIAEKFSQNISNTEQKNLLFVGNTGTGKTFISNCIAYEAIHNGYTVLYQTAPMLMDMIMDAKYSFDKFNPDNKIQYQNVFDVDLLIIDDLGTENLNNSRFTELFNIINTRLLRNKKTIISTNLMLNELGKEYDERVMSRLIGNYIICKFIGDDIRLEKKKLAE